MAQTFVRPTWLANVLRRGKRKKKKRCPERKDWERGHTVQILKFEGLMTWMLRSLGLSDQIIFPFIISFAGST